MVCLLFDEAARKHWRLEGSHEEVLSQIKDAMELDIPLEEFVQQIKEDSVYLVPPDVLKAINEIEFQDEYEKCISLFKNGRFKLSLAYVRG